ncbi:hypothetical protein P280DRAFT_470952 [Massarina eburnea CBS 473.64]|uniref:C2H2-type domain-containing protein n=1 Tax=Massarina eburnea CBS 473.64 TaxID=1395130 RepID=A0A6A6RW18_9PLEO|nr:hypothetical protein P280DRAFT_470952 [Massarina eburnea CBS 473.64]
MNGNSSVPSLVQSQSSHASSGFSTQQSTLVGSCSQSSRTSTSAFSQQPSGAGSAYSGSSALRAAVTKFRAHLTGPQLQQFKTTTYEQLCNEIMQIQKEQEKKKNMMNLSRIQGYLEAMHQFGKVIEVFLNMSGLVAFVWGPIKFLLLTASNFADTFETLLEAYEQIGEQLPLLEAYESLFHQSPHMLQALENMYMDILEFHSEAVKFYSGDTWKRLFRSSWKNFGTKFNGILKSLARHKNLIECRASLSQYQLYREDMSDMKVKLDGLIEEEKIKKMKTVKEWLAVGSLPDNDHEEFCEVRKKNPRTGGWILNHEYIRDWMIADVPNSPIVWMTGIPGAGKTILASTIIDECRTKSEYITTHFYCHYSGQGANTAVGVIRGILDQLVDKYPQLLPHCHSQHARSGEPALRSFGLARKLFEDFCNTVPKQFIVIDGLDECESFERKQLLRFLMDVIGHCDEVDPGKLRVMFVSQEYPDIKNALHSLARVVPKIVSVTPADNKGDIQIYVRSWVNHIAERHAPFNEELAECLRDLTVDRAGGMFLYAKLVMDNLYHQPSRGELISAIQEDNFPKGLEGAYERILVRIKNTSREPEWRMATKLLGWMVCCKRQLTWKEIQAALSIDTRERTIDWKNRRLRTHIHDICGSLVTISGDRVALVHSTAKYYITKVSNDIYQPTVECELATLCLQYLTFSCFQVDPATKKEDEPMYEELMLKGYFAFQDYAIATWFLHVSAFVKTGKDLFAQAQDPETLSTLLQDVSTAIDEFMDRYDEENFYDIEVEKCRNDCEVFKDQDFYKDIVSLTSYIYQYQTKGFDARYKISIKSLKAALDRNRELLEKSVTKLKESHLKKYKEFYDAEKRFKCDKITCIFFSEGFKDHKSRKKHVNCHDRPYKCEVDDCLGAEGYANSRDLEKHTRAFHPNISDLAERFNSTPVQKAKAAFTCTLCGQSFTRKLIMQDHEKSHRGERPHECAECGKSFTRKNDLTRHRRIHDRPH